MAIIILNWNGYATTRQCLDSIAKLDYENYRVVIVDNNSTDGSPERFKKEFPGHHLLANDRNLGFSEGNNVGIRWALAHDFDYVLLLNYDTTIQPDAITKLVEVAETNTEFGMVGPCIRHDSRPDKIWSFGGRIHRRTGRPVQNTKATDNTLVPVEWISGCALLVKTDVIKTIGLMDADYFFGIEDVDWCLRAGKTGVSLAVVPDAVVYHKIAVSRFSQNYTELNQYYRIRNLLLFVDRNGSFSFAFWLSFLNTILKRTLWALIKADFWVLRAISHAVRDFRSKTFGERSGI